MASAAAVFRRGALRTGAQTPVFAGDPVSVVVTASFTAEPLAGSLRQWSSAFGIDVAPSFVLAIKSPARSSHPIASFAAIWLA